MFGREKAHAATAAPEATPVPASAKAGGKGRATPSRREAEQRNRRPLIGAPPPPKGATREERKANRQARTKAARDTRMSSRAALANGDERYLPPKDKGPVRRFVRDTVDARRNVGEYFLPIALVSLLIGVVQVHAVHLISLGVLYVMIVVIILDSVILRQKVLTAVTEKFGADETKGVSRYAILRAIQFRRGRMPKPQVERGQYPK